MRNVFARGMVVVMDALGFRQFSIVGHDRGGRVAYRLALDHPERVERLAVLDIAPTQTVWERADARFALAYWPWSLLAKPEPLPERLIEAAPEAVIDAALAGWGTPSSVVAAGTWSVRGPFDAGHFFPEEVPNETAEALRRLFLGGG